MPVRMQSFIFSIRKKIMRLKGLKMLFYPLYIANKTECFSYNDGHVIYIWTGQQRELEGPRAKYM